MVPNFSARTKEKDWLWTRHLGHLSLSLGPVLEMLEILNNLLFSSLFYKMVTTSDCDYTSSKSIDFSGSKLEHAKVPREAAKTAHNITNNDHKGVEGR